MNNSTRSVTAGLLAGATLVAAATGASAADVPLHPESLVRDVIAANPGVAALERAVDAAAAREVPAGALEDPVLSYAVAPASLGADGLDPGHIVGIAQPLPWFGKRAARRDVARAQTAAARADLDTARRRAARAARGLYADWYAVHESLRINDRQRALLEELRDTADGLYRAGGGTQYAIISAEVRVTQREREALDLRATAAGLRARINALRNTPIQRPVASPIGLPEPPALPPDDRLRSALRDHHPALAQLQARRVKAGHQQRLARLDDAPDLRLTANYLGTLPRDENRFQVGVKVNLPFGRARRDATRDATRADAEGLDARFNEQLAQLLAELASVTAAERAAAETVTLYRSRLLPLAQQAVESALADYASGDGPVGSVIDAESDLLSARLGLVRARADRFRQRANLALLAGGALDADLLTGVAQ